MKMLNRVAFTLALLFAVGCATTPPPATVPPPAPMPEPVVSTQPVTSAAATYSVPIRYHKLDNGLKVVLSPDHTAPTAAVGIYYNIGFRVEPRNRTGFAHLFEHLMF